MKKWMFLVAIVIVVIVLALILIPSKRAWQLQTNIAANPKGFTRVFLTDMNWNDWWPGSIQDSVYEFEQVNFRLLDKSYSSISLSMEAAGENGVAHISIFPITPDSVRIDWSCTTNSQGTATRVGNLFKPQKFRQVSTDLLSFIRTHFEKNENIYGTPIHETLVKDSILISMSNSLSVQPDMQTVYSMLDSLKRYTASNQAQITGMPMLNIGTTDSISWQVRVAIPVDKKLPPSGNIQYKWMLGGGKILYTDIKGGPAAINEGFRQLEHYLQDHDRVTPAIPFQSLVTDRRQQPDSTAWLTRLYYPVM